MKSALLASALVLVATRADAEPVSHLPPAEAPANEALELVAKAPKATPTLVAHYRTAGTPTFQALELVRRDDASWVAVLPATAIVPPGIEYYLAAGDQPVFASPQAPHQTVVAVATAVARRSRDEARAGARRSRVRTAFEWVDYGTRLSDFGTERIVDRYYRVDAEFTYRLWAYPLETLRVGYTRLLGETRSNVDESTPEAGFKVAGWFELGLAPVEGLGLDARAMVLATQAGFNVGGRAELRVGLRDATHVAAAVEHMADVGTSGQFRLGWATVPRTPMAAIVEITNLPASHRPAGVRLLYDIGRDLAQGVRIGLRIGYTAREQQTRGFTTGANASIDF